MQGRSRDADTQNRLAVIAGEGQGRIHRETGPEAHITVRNTESWGELLKKTGSSTQCPVPA